MVETNKFLYTVVDILGRVANETGKTISQVAISWLVQQDTVSNIVFGARKEQQLIENLDSVGWLLTVERLAELDNITAQTPIYPHWVCER